MTSNGPPNTNLKTRPKIEKIKPIIETTMKTGKATIPIIIAAKTAIITENKIKPAKKVNINIPPNNY